MKKVLYIKINSPISEGISHFWTWKWSSSMPPISLNLENGVIALFSVTLDKYSDWKDVWIIPEQIFTLIFPESHKIYTEYLDKNSLWEDILLEIYEIYKKLVQIIFHWFHTIARMDFTDYRIIDFWEFSWKKWYISWHKPLSISFDGVNFQELKIIEKEGNSNTRWRNPVYLRKNLLDKKKWESLRSFFEHQDLTMVNKDYYELLHLKSKSLLYTDRFSILEFTVLMEVLIIEFVSQRLEKMGFLKKKVKELEIDFDKALNAYLPLLLSKTQRNKFQKHINNLDALRKIRNRILHQNSKQVDKNIVKPWIDSWLRIFSLLKE